LREALAAKDAEIARLPPCPWTRAQVEQTVAEFLTPRGANAGDIAKMLLYLAASLPETRREP
jgi:hypothetical protein